MCILVQVQRSFLMFIGLCIVIIFQYINPYKRHMSQSLFNLTTALHVLDIIIAHIQEHKTTVTTASVNCYTVIDSLNLTLSIAVNRLRWSRGSMLAFGTQVRGFKPGRSRPIFKGEKIFSTPFFGGEVKPSVSCRRFAACKRSLELRGSRILDKIFRNISRPRRVSPSAARGLSHHWT